jgi:putative DNA primase/helicase
MRALPMPEASGLIEQELGDLINVRDAADFLLIVAWLVGCFNPRGPYPILVINGEQGTGKTSLVRLLRSLVDPAKAPVRAPPRDEQTLVNEAHNAWVLAFDNLSDIFRVVLRCVVPAFDRCRTQRAGAL